MQIDWKLINGMYTYFVEHNVTASEQVIKLFEEAGEVAGAWIGWTGSNPRKGVTHTRADIIDELMDVIITACVALNFFTEEPEKAFAAAFEDRSKNGQRLSEFLAKGE